MGQAEELTAYRQRIVAHIAKRELAFKAFISWLSWFDDNCRDYYVKTPDLERIKLIRGPEWKEFFLDKTANQPENGNGSNDTK